MPDEALIRVYVNMTNHFQHYKEGDTLLFTVGFPVVPEEEHHPTTGEMLGWIYTQLNMDEPTEKFADLYRFARNRSFSVGDVVRINDNEFWACDTTGWSRVTVAEDQILDRPVMALEAPDEEDGPMYMVQAHDSDGNMLFGESDG